HEREELRAGEAVAVLPGEGAAELDDQRGHVGGDRLHAARVLAALQVEVDADVEAAMPRVPEEPERGAVAVDDLLEAAGVGAELLRGDPGVLHELLRLDVARGGGAVEEPGGRLPE